MVKTLDDDLLGFKLTSAWTLKGSGAVVEPRRAERRGLEDIADVGGSQNALQASIYMMSIGLCNHVARRVVSGLLIIQLTVVRVFHLAQGFHLASNLC